MTLRTFPDQKSAIDEPVQNACLTLPIAGRANCKVRFAGAETRGHFLSIHEAVYLTGDLLKNGKKFQAVCIEGPGDALADPQDLLKSIDVLEKTFPEIEIRLTTNGLGAAEWASALAEKRINRITLLTDAVDAETARKIFAWIRPGKRTIALPEAVNILLEQQRKAVPAFHQAGIAVHLQTTVYPGMNDQHVSSIAREMAALGAGSITIRPFMVDAGVEARDMEEAIMESCAPSVLLAAQAAASPFLEVIDYQENTIPLPQGECAGSAGTFLSKPTCDRPNIAVTSSNGMDVDLHLGQASRILIYGPREDGPACLLEARQAPEAGQGPLRWQALARECLHDCFILLVANAGKKPKQVLAEMGIQVIVCEDNIEGMVDVLYGGGKKKKLCR